MKEAEKGSEKLVLRGNWKNCFDLPRKKKEEVMGTWHTPYYKEGNGQVFPF